MMDKWQFSHTLYISEAELAGCILHHPMCEGRDCHPCLVSGLDLCQCTRELADTGRGAKRFNKVQVSLGCMSVRLDSDIHNEAFRNLKVLNDD
jgi:hypothetical protein